MYLNNIRIFDYPRFAEPLKDIIRGNAEKIANENNIEIEFIKKSHIRKEDIILKKLKKRGYQPGLVHILSDRVLRQKIEAITYPTSIIFNISFITVVALLIYFNKSEESS